MSSIARWICHLVAPSIICILGEIETLRYVPFSRRTGGAGAKPTHQSSGHHALGDGLSGWKWVLNMNGGMVFKATQAVYSESTADSLVISKLEFQTQKILPATRNP